MCLSLDVENFKMGDAPQSQHVPLFNIITYPRTCSNLLVRILALHDQPSTYPAPDNGGYFFMPSFKASVFEGTISKNVDQLSEEEVAKMKQAVQSCADTVGQHISEAKKLGKSAVVKEHATFLTNPVAMTKFLYGPESTTQQHWSVEPSPAAFSGYKATDQSSTHSLDNETILSDEFLKAWKPTFLIRSPLAAFASFYRAIKGNLGGAEPSEELVRSQLTLHFNRALYDWYARQFEANANAQDGHVHKDEDATWPIVLDADDIMSEPGVTMRFAEIIGLDPAKLQYSWDTTSQESLEAMTPENRLMLSTLLASSGINKSKLASNLSLETEAAKWREEFGEEIAGLIERCVRDALPDYEFMKSKRLRPS